MEDPAILYLMTLLAVAVISVVGQYLASEQVRAIGAVQNSIAGKQLELDEQRHEQFMETERERRNYEQKRQAWAELLAACGKFMTSNGKLSKAEHSPFLDALTRAVTDVRLYCSPRSADFAAHAVNVLGGYLLKKPGASRDAAHLAFGLANKAARHELGIDEQTEEWLDNFGNLLKVLSQVIQGELSDDDQAAKDAIARVESAASELKQDGQTVI